ERCYTSYEVFRAGAAAHPDAGCLGHREVDSRGAATPYVFQTYHEVEERVDHFAAGLEHGGLTPRNADGMKLLGLYSRNRPEWIIAEQAAFCHGAVTVPMYDTLGPETVEYIAAQCGVAAVVCGGATELARLAEVAASGRCPSLAVAIVMDPLPTTAAAAVTATAVAAAVGGSVGMTAAAAAVAVAAAAAAGLRVLHFSEVEAAGAAHPRPHRPPASVDAATFCYTSGTTGEPKGAVITHQNLISDAAAALSAGGVLPTAEDVYFSYLPLPHIFERAMQVVMFCHATSVGFFRGDPTLLVEDLRALRPTIMPAVPRILNRFHDRLTQVWCRRRTSG
ncbi:unnamed protein product, partial [Phaeothamnion confervicola]